MQLLKVILGFVGLLLVGPIIFVIYISVQAGCFLCLEGDAAGSAAEMWLNLGLIAVLVGGAVLWLRSRLLPKS